MKWIKSDNNQKKEELVKCDWMVKILTITATNKSLLMNLQFLIGIIALN